MVTEADCTAPSLVATIAPEKIGEPVRSVTVQAGAQLDYYQSVIAKMGRAQVDRFARFFVMLQTGHGLAGTNYGTSCDGNILPVAPVPNTWDRLALLFDWVERGVAPGMSVTVTAGEKGLPLCSYPTYPKYVGGPEASAASYRCTTP